MEIQASLLRHWNWLIEPIYRLYILTYAWIDGWLRIGISPAPAPAPAPPPAPPPQTMTTMMMTTKSEISDKHQQYHFIQCKIPFTTDEPKCLNVHVCNATRSPNLHNKHSRHSRITKGALCWCQMSPFRALDWTVGGIMVPTNSWSSQCGQYRCTVKMHYIQF